MRSFNSVCQQNPERTIMMTTPQKPSLATMSGSSTAKPLRADARQNRARILEAAEIVFTAKGMSASTDEISRQAGVGIGTVFRHFPTKEALIEAILVGRMQRLTEKADSLSSAPDPGEAFFRFFTYVVDQSETKNAFADALAEAGVDVRHATLQVGQELLQVIDTLLTRAQQAGSVRDDVGVTEVIALVVGTSRAAEHTGWDRDILARTLAIVFDGLRPAESH
jgi:AcrR family transcriptional regulator